MKKILCFGGGNAVPRVLLAELKKRKIDVSSATSMADSGGSTGQLRADFNVLPPGDMRRHLLALSDAPEWKKELFNFKFGHEEFAGGHRGHNFGNIFLAGLEHVLQDYEKALKIAHEFLEVKGRCYPATIEKTNVAAELENGEEMVGEDEIDVPKKHNPDLEIKSVYLKPRARAYPPLLLAIKNAGAITLGPGDLYSSIIPCLLPEGIKEAMQKTKAKKIFICPAMTKRGETQGFSVEGFAKEVEKYLGCKLDYVLFNSEIPSKERVEEYKKTETLLLEPVSFSGVRQNKKFIGANLLVESGPVVYDPKKVVDVLLKLVK